MLVIQVEEGLVVDVVRDGDDDLVFVVDSDTENMDEAELEGAFWPFGKDHPYCPTAYVVQEWVPETPTEQGRALIGALRKYLANRDAAARSDGAPTAAAP